jgi:DNA-binding SARP family transcriptional activator/Tfp pilus assembly protein PilF
MHTAKVSDAPDHSTLDHAVARQRTGRLHIGVLGPLQVLIGNRTVPIRAGRLRALLAVLAMSAGRPAAPERLATAVWGEELPGDGRRSVQLYITRLRSLLGADAIRTGPEGYILTADEVDALRFIQLLDDAAAQSDRHKELASLDDALKLWRGAPFEGLRAIWLEQVEAPRLIDRYLAAAERSIDLNLAMGRSAEVLGQLRELTVSYPLHERFWGQLMIALYRTGRQAESLATYQRLYRLLAEDLGLRPGGAIQELHQRILIGDSMLGTSSSQTAAIQVPRQLPAVAAEFSGRSKSIAQLDELLRRVGDKTTVAVIAGGAGVGKTTLALHWAHRVADRFPDGQLFVDLRGFGPSGQASKPLETIRGLLEAFGVSPSAAATDMSAQIGLYRSMLARRRVLIVLDNAVNAEQVRPLLPGGPGCLVVVTTRNEMPGLISDGGHPVTLDALTPEESRQLLALRLGFERVEAEPQAVEQIIKICAGLPLALSIAAARGAMLPQFDLEAVADTLLERCSLDALATPDASTDIRALFSWSYNALSAEAQRLFRILSLHRGVDIGAAAAASLAGIPPAVVGPVLQELRMAHLLTEHLPGRFSFHELLRAYSAELLRENESDVERGEAERRLLDHYLHTAGEAALLIEPLRDPIRFTPHRGGVTPEEFRDREQALLWFHNERSALVAMVDQAHASGHDTHAWQLAWALADYLQWRGCWHDRIVTLQTALASTRRLRNRTEQARAHRCLGTAYTKIGQYERAHNNLRQALELYLELDDPTGQVRTHQSLSSVLEQQKDHTAALSHVERAMELYPPTGSKAGLGRLLNSAGWCHAQLGNLTEALDYCSRALILAQEANDRTTQAATWDSLGYIRHRLGEYAAALEAYQHALGLRRAIGHRSGEANTLSRIGDAHNSIGDDAAARRSWQSALDIYEETEHPAARAVRAKLSQTSLERDPTRKSAPANTDLKDG